MENTMKISASVVSHLGMVKKENKDNFYINGRYMFEHDTDNVQVSIENNSSTYLFAVCDDMERQLDEDSLPISLTKELRKFHERVKSSRKDIRYQFEQLYESIDETSNLIHSMDLVKSRQEAGKSGTAVLFISDNKAAVIDTDGCRTYLLRDGKLKSLTVDYKKTERLLRMGIITDEQAKVLASRMGTSSDCGQIQSRKTDVFELKEGDLFLLCTNGLTDCVDEDRIYELLDSDETDMISNLLLKEALKAGGEDNITIMTVKIEALNKRPIEQESGYYSKGRTVDIRQIVKVRPQILHRTLSVITSILLIVGLGFGAYKLWGTLSKPKDPDIATHSPSTQADDTTGGYSDTEDSDLEEDDTYTDSEGEDFVDAETDSTDEELLWPVEYTVQRGDSLYQISSKFYNDSNKYTLIMEANEISDPNRIFEGQVLIIPKP
jgi:serine/threonine protein phosphatase PrpC/LysM repeat protein